MENKDRLDEFLQHKFAEDDPAQRFAFREEYWLQAQTLIEADERRKRRRGLFWWWLAGGLGMALVAVWWMAGGPAESPARAASDTAQPIPAPVQHADKLIGISGESDNAKQPRQELTLNKPLRKEQLPDSSSRIAGNIFKQGSSGIQKPATERAVILIPGSREKESGAKGLGNKVKSRPSTPDASLSLNRNTPEMSIKAALIDPAYAAEGDTEHVTSPSPSGEGRGGVSQARTTNNSEAAERKVPLPTTPLNFLPTIFQLLQRPLPRLSIPRKPALPIAETPPERHRNWRMQLGVIASGSTPTGHLQDESPGIGGGLSARFQRKGSAFSWNADLIWRWRQGGFPDTLDLMDSGQFRYSFGYIWDWPQQRVSGTHWLELPVYVQYRWKTINAELGAMPTLLTAVQGREDRFRQTSLAPDPALTGSQKIRLANRYFTQFSASVFAGAEWQPTNRLGVGLRLHYQPGTLLQSSDFSIPRRGPLWGELRVRFFI